MAKRSDKDWKAIEKDYRAGTLSNRKLAEKYGVSESAIRKKADADGWVRTKCAPAHHAEAPRQPASEVLPPLRRPAVPPDPDAAPLDPTELGQDLVRRMLRELDDTTTRMDEVEDAIYEETKDDQSGRRRSAMLKAVSLPARAMTLKTLGQALVILGATTAGKKGKKEQRQEAAKAAGTGRYATPAGPKLVVDNG